MLDTDIIFWDASYTFHSGSSGCAAGFYIEDVAAHEFGHALGLGHSAVGSATMYAGAGYCDQSLRVLDPDDLAGIEYLYPASGSQPPAAPTGLAATVCADAPANAVSLAWSDNATNEDVYAVERSADGSSWSQVAQVPANTVTYRSDSLQAGASYWFRVRASNSGGFSAYTNTAAATTAAPSGPPTAPANPYPWSGATGVSVDADVTWQSSGATSFDVYFAAGTLPALYRTGLTGASLALPPLSAGTTYSWRVVARNPNGEVSGATWKFTTKTIGKGRKK